MNNSKYLFFLFLFSLVTAHKVYSQDNSKIPDGVVYKRAAEEVNNTAKIILAKELSKTTYALFDNLLYIGPLLWKRYSNIPAINKIQGGDIQFKLPNGNTTTSAPGKLIQNNKDFEIIWNQVLIDIGNQKTSFRKLTYDELRYYWAVIFYDIEEPVFIVETINKKFLVHFNKNNFKLIWLDEVN